MDNTPMPQPYKYVEFPRVVYGPGDDCITINSEAERPDGWQNSPGVFGATENLTKDADKARKSEIRQFLDLHEVEYSPKIGLTKLVELEAALVAHLAPKEHLTVDPSVEYFEDKDEDDDSV